MGKIPATPLRFKRWLDKQHEDLPTDLYGLGEIYHLCLCTIALNRNNPDALKAAKQLTATAMREFMSAYAEWKKQNLS